MPADGCWVLHCWIPKGNYTTILVSRSMVKSYSALHTCVVCTSLSPWDHMEGPVTYEERCCL